VEVLATLPSRLRLGFGCLDVRCPDAESPETIINRVKSALQFAPATRISLNPDCGFAPSGSNPIPLDEPYVKLKALVQAAARLRSQFQVSSPVGPVGGS
jgi:5-methyltetrahydropteroyltriglutamate--homocysteine methyltransferase